MIKHTHDYQLPRPGSRILICTRCSRFVWNPEIVREEEYVYEVK